MDPDKAEQNVSKSSRSPMLMFIAICVSFIVCLAIIQHWKSFDWTSKFLAISLLVLLLPLRLSRGEKHWLVKPDAPSPFEAYIWVMIATVLFSR